MTKRLLIAGLFLFSGGTFCAQRLQAQELSTSSQEARPQSPATSRDEGKQSFAPPVRRESSTVGNAASAPLGVKGKLRYFAIETFRPGVYPAAAFYVGLIMANPPKAYPREWRQGFPAFAR